MTASIRFSGGAGLLLLGLMSCDPAPQTETPVTTAPPPPDTAAVHQAKAQAVMNASPYVAHLRRNPDGTWGYEISRGGEPLIRQTTIPGRSGTAGFTDSTQARRVANLVVDKISHDVMPPTVSAHELDSLLK